MSECKSLLRAGLMVVAVAALAGCASYGAAFLQSSPDGAEVINLEDDSILGTTPVRVWWKGEGKGPQYINVRFQKDGYRDKVAAFWVNMRHRSREDALAEAAPVKVEMEKNQ
ncbi:MAG: hypothetical protein LJE84_13390 [Gammaproteobacteria bacterium]|nr:hypothetical protein [Gammaproteobacteria bacterium]